MNYFDRTPVGMREHSPYGGNITVRFTLFGFSCFAGTKTGFYDTLPTIELSGFIGSNQSICQIILLVL